MADDDHPSPPPSSPTPTVSTASVTLTDRTELLARARAFLSSAQVANENVSAKRRFLTDKGLADAEIDRLLAEVVRETSALW
jgi:uncharacterized membrane protein YqiK